MPRILNSILALLDTSVALCAYSRQIPRRFRCVLPCTVLGDDLVDNLFEKNGDVVYASRWLRLPILTDL